MKLLLLAFFAFTLATASGRDVYETLAIGGQTYSKVQVLSSNESSISIRHSRGISQLALADLPVALQEKYGYKASADQARTQKLDQIRRQQTEHANQRLANIAKVAQSRASSQVSGASRSLRSAFAQFGQEPRVQAELDLRSAFRSHGIGIRKQRGASCSVHAVAAALEYQFAEEKGKKINVSERYLVEATSRSLGRKARNDLDEVPGGSATVEEGFSLEQVFQAIRGHGLALELPSGSKSGSGTLREFEDINFSPFQIPGSQSRAGVANLVHVLNAELPVVVGVAWPNDALVKNTSLLSKQPPAQGVGHAVTIVGYRSATGKLEDSKFIFRNSWGARWGAGGYGFFTYEYLLKNLWSSYVVELR